MLLIEIGIVLSLLTVHLDGFFFELSKLSQYEFATKLKPRSDNDDKFRVIKPNDISSLFDFKTAKKNPDTPENFDQDFDDSDDNDIEFEESEIEPEDAAQLNLISTKTLTKVTENVDTMVIDPKLAIDQGKIFDNGVTTATVPISSSTTRNNDELALSYVDLNVGLNLEQNSDVLEYLTLIEAPDAFQNPSKVFEYNPAERNRPNPMQFGAYRRFRKRSEDDDENIMDEKGGRFTVDRTKTSKKKNNNDNKFPKKMQKDASKFMEELKKLGSGPIAKGSGSVTGVAEPPPNMKPITPKKAPSRGSKQKVITPSEIESLFATKESTDSVESSKRSLFDVDIVEEDEEDEDEGEDDGDDEDDRSKTSTKVAKEYSATMIDPNAPLPQWILDAEKEKKRLQSPKNKRKKRKITDDLRFWGAIIAGAGFATAFINIYQQTGGFGTSFGMGGTELII